MQDYEALLDKAKTELPEVKETTERFEIPNVRGHVEGNKTIVSNFHQIATHLRRKPRHLLKFILKELATPGELKQKVVIFGSKVPAKRINDKIRQYADTFLFCKECQKPDTKLFKEGDIYYIRCQACGARHSVYAKI
ncbi:translation initiation factor IF-2 subunit beta [Candidatus Woesearchaeota archaeon]|nr:translation initiation factor IF-2 subunit beta [Candidatus Woesearchaeota archaeon]